MAVKPPKKMIKANLFVKKKIGKKVGKKIGKSRKKSYPGRSLDESKSDMELLDSIIQNKVDGTDYDDDEDDLYFVIYCVFNDWNRLREYLQER